MKILFTLIILPVCFSAYSQHPWLVKDINSNNPVNQLADGTFIGGDGSFQNPAIGPPDMYKVNSFALFFATDGKIQRGLWRSDGTKNGTYFISSLNTDTTQQLYIPNAYSTGNLLYFSKITNDGLSGLWRSDGTKAGTFPIFSGPDLTGDVGSGTDTDFYFVGYQQIEDSVYTNLYKTDGTLEGTHLYFQADKEYGSIHDFFPDQAINNSIKEFNNHIYFDYFNPNNNNTGYEIWVGDGVNPPHELCDFNPGPLGTLVDNWVNVNNKLVVSVEIEQPAPADPQSELICINAGNTCPLVLDDNMESLTLYSNLHNNDEAAISGNNLFFQKKTKSNHRVTEVTDGTKEGTIVSSLDSSTGYIIGVCTKGAICSTGDYFSTAGTKTYIWNGNSPNSYHILSDSLSTGGNNYFAPFEVVQVDTAVFVLCADGVENAVRQTNVDGSYCYRVSTLATFQGKGVNLGDTAYLAFGDADPTGVFDCGTEPVLLKSYDKIWTGKISADWNNSNNWLPAGVPKFSQSVVIPPTQYDPVINTQASCKDLFLNNTSITVNKSANLDVHGYYFSFNHSGINGAGSLTRKGTFANTTYGNGAYNIDSINIDGADWDLTSMNFAEPNSVGINSVINFKSDNKLTMNTISLYMAKKPFFTGFNNKRYVVNNRIYPVPYYGDSSYITYTHISLGSYTSVVTDSVATIPVGTSTSSYTPLTITYPYLDPFGASVYLVNGVKKNGNNGDSITTGVVNKTWMVGDDYSTIQKLQCSWSAMDEMHGFNHNACFIAYYDGSKWIKGTTQTAVLKNGLYSINTEQSLPNSFTPYIVSSDLNVLPVNLTNFTAQLINEDATALLRWQTATEINSSYFNIQRSLNGINFTPVGKVNAAGNSASLKTYSFTDDVVKLNGGTIYYQIEEADKDGKTTLSQIRTVKKSSRNIFTISPNPAKDIININGKDLQQVQIFDESGKLLLTKQTIGADNITISVNHLNRGTYLVILKDTQGNTETKKLLIE